jgi:beta-N-acetylhexosaminidase
MVLHCHGIMSEMQDVVANTPLLTGKALKRAQAAMARLVRVDHIDEVSLRDTFADHMAMVA